MQSLEYLRWLRENHNACVVTGRKAEHYHHLRPLGMGADRKKPHLNHFTVIPLCAEVHHDIHSMSRADFRAKWGFPGQNVFIELWQWVQRANIEFFYGEKNESSL
jgi:hypothetical protein